jgi:hypothetical protein
MEQYNEINIQIAGRITSISVLGGLLEGWLAHSPMFINAAFIPVGLTAILFNHDLAMRDRMKYKANYKLFRGAYMFVGAVFIAISIITLINH